MQTSLALGLTAAGLLTLAVRTPELQEEGVAVEVAETPASVVGRAVEAAERMLDTLDDAQKAAVLFAFDDLEQRERWSNLPVSMVERRGLRMGDLSAAQQEAVSGLLGVLLSPEGMSQVEENRVGDQLLVRPGGGRVVFGYDEYFVSILGVPSRESPWSVQFGGHHLALNLTMAGTALSMSPTLTGGQPADFELAGVPVRQLGEEEDLGFALVQSLDEEQREAAVVAERFEDLRFGPGVEEVVPRKEGLCASDLNEAQEAQLLRLIGARLAVLNEVHAEVELERVRARLGEVWFSWAGSTTPGEPASFRIQGPNLIVEFAPQGSRGDPMQHLHAMYRNPENAWGVRDVEALEGR